GSFFQNNIKQLTWDNPFFFGPATPANPTSGLMTLYPDNHKHSVNFAGAGDLTKYLHFAASITPGWLRQNENFAPYSTNGSVTACGATGNINCTSLTALPEGSLHGDVQTLAMNYTLVSNPWKNIEL